MEYILIKQMEFSLRFNIHSVNDILRIISFVSYSEEIYILSTMANAHIFLQNFHLNAYKN